MKKVKLDVEETLKYRREIIVEVPDDMTESELERLLNKAERTGSLSEFMYLLDANNVENPDGYDDDLNSPDDQDIECLEYDFVEESEAKA